MSECRRFAKYTTGASVSVNTVTAAACLSTGTHARDEECGQSQKATTVASTTAAMAPAIRYTVRGAIAAFMPTMPRHA